MPTGLAGVDGANYGRMSALGHERYVFGGIRPF